MTNKKEKYNSPKSEVLAAAYEELLCQSRSSEDVDTPTDWEYSGGWA